MEQDQDFHDESDSQPLRVRVDLSSILGSLPPRLIPLQKTIRYVRRNKTDLKKHREKEKELKRMVLQAAEGGHLDVIRQALPVLHTVQQRLELPLARLSHPPHPELNFDDRRGLWKEQFYTPLMYACEGGHGDMVGLLLDEGAQAGYIGGHYITKGKYKKRIGPGLSAMHVASIQGRADIVQLLITRAEDGLLEGSLSDILNAKTKDRWTPLMYAVKEGHIEVVQLLLKQKSLEVLAVNRKGQTALHIAGLHSRPSCLQAMHTALAEREDSREELAKEEENPYLQTDKTGYNVLHRICKGCRWSEEGNASVKTLKWLFETMPHLDLQTFHNLGTKEKGYTMLLLACDNGNEGLVEYLLSEKAVDVSCTAEDGKTGLHLAAMHDYSKIAELLISHGISLTAQDKEYKKGSDELVGEDTALHIAMKKSSTHVEEMIRSKGKENGESLDIKNKSGETPDEVKQEDIIPLEIRRLGEEAVQRYRQLLRRGKKKKMPRCNLIALGEERVGKTSLLCLLMGKEFDGNRKPTQGIDNECVDVVTSVHLSSQTWKKEEEGDRTRKSDEQFAYSVAEQLPKRKTTPEKQSTSMKEDDLKRAITGIDEYLKDVEKKAQKETEPQVSAPATPPNVAQNTPSESTSRKLSVTTVSKSEARAEVHEDPSTTPRKDPLDHQVSKPMVPDPQPKEPYVTPVPQILPSQRQETRPIINTEKYSRVSRETSKKIATIAKQGLKEKEPELQYNTLDFAGQLEYRAMHHCFIVRRAIYLVVFNLQKAKEALRAPTDENQKALEEIRYWLNSIHAHIHKIEKKLDGSCLKRILLVGTHRCPKEKDMPDEDLKYISDEIKCRYMTGTPVLNDMYRADPSERKNWFAAVENSIDGRDEEDRKKSGACSLQESIHAAWNELPFKKEEYPTTWLRFEAHLIQKRDKAIVDAEEIRKIARDTYGIGEEMEEDIEMALGFFHDTGTIVYPRKLPTLYLSEEQKKVLDRLILLEPAWLTKKMRIVMELQTGNGPELTNEEKEDLQKTGCIKLSVLRKCCQWKDLSEGDFENLILMLQAFCLIFPLTTCESLATHDTTTTLPSAKYHCHSQDESYLIPSKLCDEPLLSDKQKKRFNFTFVFDFCGFLPIEVYHRLLCLMVKKQKHSRDCKPRGTFTANYFMIHTVEKCNWLVQRKDCKLVVSVKYPPSQTYNPSSYVHLIHMKYLRAICNENGSSLQGLEYVGGPEHECKESESGSVVEFVSFPEKENLNWQCDYCLESFCLLDAEFLFKAPMAPERSVTSVAPSTSKTGANLQPYQNKILVASPGSNGQPSRCAGVGAHIQSGTLGSMELHVVYSKVISVAAQWRSIGSSLGLLDWQLATIKADNPNSVKGCLWAMLAEWLKKAYDVERNGEPTMARLAQAVRDPAGGNNPALADNL